MVILGLLEYIFDVDRLIDAMVKYQRIVISYNQIELVPDRVTRRGHAWVNDFGIDQIGSLFANRGFLTLSRYQLDNSQYLWLFSREQHRNTYPNQFETE